MPHWTDFLDAEGPDGAYLPWKKVEPRVGISRTTAWRLQRSGDFPKPYVVSPGRVAYRESEVEAWKASRGHRSAASNLPGPVLPKLAEQVKPEAQSGTLAAPPPSLVLAEPVPKPSKPISIAPPVARGRRKLPPKSDQLSFEF